MEGWIILTVGLVLNACATFVWLMKEYKDDGYITLATLLMAVSFTCVPFFTSLISVIYFIVLNQDKVVIGKRKK